MADLFTNTPADLVAIRAAIGVPNPALVGAALGDSITAQAGGANQSNNNGYSTWAELLSLGTLSIPPGNLFGVGGNTLAQMLARVGSITALAGQIDFCIVEGGANVGPTYADMRTSAAGIINALLAVNILPVILAAMPSTSAPAASQQMRAAYNAWMNRVARNDPNARTPFGIPMGRRIVFVDPTRYMVDYTSSAGDPIAGRTQDGLHWSPTGCYYVGREIVDVMTGAGLIQPNRPRSVTVGDAYDATNSPNGNKAPGTVAVVQGSGGTVTASAGMSTSGPLATGFNWRRWVGDATTVVTFSKDAKPDASTGERQRIQISVNSTGTNYERYFLKLASSPAVGPGDKIVFEIDYELNAAPTNCIAITANLNNNLASSQTSTATPTNFPAIAHKGTLITPVYTVPASGVTTVDPILEIWLANSVSGGAIDISVDRFTCRKIN